MGCGFLPGARAQVSRHILWDARRPERLVCQGGLIVNLYFAPYAPDDHGVPLADTDVRLARTTDLDACAELCAQREGGDPDVWASRLAVDLGEGRVLFVAEQRGCIVGYGRVAWLTPVSDGGRNAPDGWYLSGVVVDVRFRRRGIGRALTQARCAWAWQHERIIYYVAGAANRASNDLHRELGFREVTRDFVLPGVTFARDDGVLFAWDPSSKGKQVVELGVYAAR